MGTSSAAVRVKVSEANYCATVPRIHDNLLHRLPQLMPVKFVLLFEEQFLHLIMKTWLQKSEYQFLFCLRQNKPFIECIIFESIIERNNTERAVVNKNKNKSQTDKGNYISKQINKPPKEIDQLFFWLNYSVPIPNKFSATN